MANKNRIITPPNLAPPGGAPPQGPPPMKVNQQQLEDVVCENCGCTHFREVSFLKRVPSFMTQTGQPGFVGINQYACAKCGHINEEFMNTLRGHWLRPENAGTDEGVVSSDIEVVDPNK